MQRFMMAFASYTLCCILAYLSYLAGIMEWRGLIGLLLICSFNNIVFYVAFRTGLNLRASDPSLTTIQMCAAVVALTYGMYFANESRPVLLLVYVIILMFGIFRLVLSGFLFVSLFMIASYGLNLFLLYRFRFQDVNFKMEFLHMLLFALMLVALSVIGSYISILRKKLHKAMCVNLELSIRDELTGAYNRRHIMELLENERELVSRGGATFSIVMLDIDHFKDVNDTLGHFAGDVVLRETSAVICKNLRGADFYGRFGGEEFLIVMTQTNIEGAIVCAERIRKAVEQKRFHIAGKSFGVTISLGLTDYRENENIPKIIARADKALYRAKAAGRNRMEYDSGTYQNSGFFGSGASDLRL